MTDSEGRFMATIGTGRYFLKISKPGFTTQQTDTTVINSADDILNLEISLTPEIEMISMEALKKINILNALKRILEAINPYLLAMGTGLSLISTLLVPNSINATTLAIYVFMDLLKIYFTFRFIKPFGTVRNSKDNSVIPLAVVRIFSEDKNRLLASKWVKLNESFFENT